ncbi:NYN domain-containing protein [Nocardioides panacis]|uniref:NYN domain-containing protein n=1 Tax=Nocardioides panacis TaxID=2849501 RepID=A0A975SXG4_9ACTN|nr:NYN domain-containing protein [Nocardioides panacis]QWZ07738.1 NYN domain-containing protein [Nocardioides panacis]
MPPAPDSSRLAVLIDGDNTTPTIIEALLAEIAKYGSATVKRAYGDWTTSSLRGWKEAINAHAIQPMQQFAYTTGKNATDSAMIIDAMDLLYTGNLDGFCLVTSDSDFTKLASRLRESGKTVYGFGEPRTPQALVAACDKFVYLDVLRRPDKPTKEPSDEGAADTAPSRASGSELRRDAKLVRLLREGIDAASDDDGWANLGGVGSYVAKQAPDFDSRNWGYAKLVDLVTAIDLFEVKRSAGQGPRVRERPKGETAKKAPAKTATKKASRAGTARKS